MPARVFVIACLVSLTLLPLRTLLAEEKTYPKITMPWEYLGQQPDKSFRIINPVGDAFAAIDYHPLEDLWILSLTNKTGEKHFARVDTVRVYRQGQGYLDLESAKACSDCIEVKDERSTLHIPLTQEEVELIGSGFFLDFHYDKAGLDEEENGFVFRVGLIDTGKQLAKIMKSVPGPVALSAEDFNKGIIWLLRKNRRLRKSSVFNTNRGHDSRGDSDLMKQRENKNWYSAISYGESLPRWRYRHREADDGSKYLVLVKSM
jgi:hypothetical protein